MNLLKQLVIDAVVGRGLLGEKDADQLEAEGFASVESNPLSVRWKWNREALNKLSTTQLVDLYKRER